MFDDYESALGYVRGVGRYPTVIKADGLALGKGVVIAQDLEAAKTALDEMMRGGRFGKSGERVVIEEYLEGPGGFGSGVHRWGDRRADGLVDGP